MERHSIQVSYRLNGMRLDAAISESIPGVSRRRAKAIVDMGGAYVNKKRVRIASKTVGKGDRIDVEYNEKLFEPGKKEAMSLKPEDILYFENDIIIINKPAGLPSQATRDQAVLHVIPLLEKLLSEMGHNKMDLQLVHRLDKDTTGALVIATNKDTMTFLTDQFRQHTIQKTYHALAWGVVEKAFEIKCMLSAIQPNTGNVKVVRSGGKSSQTFFEVLKTWPTLQVSLIHCRPITGRSHQIRVHLDEAGHPIIGDKVYGEGKRHKLPDELMQVATHQLLHAHTIRFQPAKDADTVEVTAPYPASFADFLRLADSL
jgi:RluA family pseudouridine synthase